MPPKAIARKGKEAARVSGQLDSPRGVRLEPVTSHLRRV
jgi:hypothetical protein